MIIMVFPIFGLITYLGEDFLGLLFVKIFMLYLAIFSVLLIVYEVYTCTYGHHEEPRYLYEQNDLDDHTIEVWKIRKDYLNRNKATGN
jgi:hypothetical protein